MRIRGRRPPADSSVSPSPSPSPSPSSSLSSYSSSVTGSHSLASSQDSSNSCSISLFGTASHRCYGLDLLVKAIHQVNAGSVVGVPYIQRRVTIRRRRRRRGLEFDALVFDELSKRKRERISNNSKKKQQQQEKNLMGLPTRIEVLQPWERRSELSGAMGLC